MAVTALAGVLFDNATRFGVDALGTTMWAVRTKGASIAIRLGAAIGVSFVLTELLKHVVGRPRPDGILQYVSPEDVLTRGGYGFPSGHSAVATVLLVFVLITVPKKYHAYAIMAAVSLYVSRMYLGMHFPLDIIGGIGVSGVVASLIFDTKMLANISG